QIRAAAFGAGPGWIGMRGTVFRRIRTGRGAALPAPAHDPRARDDASAEVPYFRSVDRMPFSRLLHSHDWNSDWEASLRPVYPLRITLNSVVARRNYPTFPCVALRRRSFHAARRVYLHVHYLVHAQQERTWIFQPPAHERHREFRRNR